MKTTRILTVLTAFILVFGLAACGSKDDAPADGDQPEEVGFTGSYLMGTGSATGNYYNFGNAVCTVVNQKTGANLTVNATGGPTDESILETIRAGANAITYTPPSHGELFAVSMERYRREANII